MQAPFSRTFFAVVILLALAKGLVWSTVLPAWYGPDEASHYAYVQEVVEDHWLARGNDPNASLYYPREILCSESNHGIGVSGEFHAEPPFGAPWVPCTSTAPADRHASAPNNPAGLYTPVYFGAGALFYLLVQPYSVETRLAAVRLWSVLLGVLAAALAYLAARWAFPESTTLGIAATVLFTLQPMISQQTAVVNNDALLIAASAAFWWRFFRALRVGLSVREAILMGALIGLAYLAKPQGILLAATLPIAYVVGLRLHKARVDVFRLVKLMAAAAAPIVAGVIAAGIFSVLAGNSTLLPATSGGVHGFHAYLSAYTDGHFERLYWLLITSFWGYFGWFQVALPNYVYVLVTLVVAIGLVGAVSLAITSSRERVFLVVSMLALAIPLALIMVLELYAFRTTGILLLQGRSFLMLLLPLIVVLIRGWELLVPPRARAGLAPAVVMAATLLNLTSLLVIINAFYG